MDSKTFYQAVLFGIVVVLLGLVYTVVFSSLKPVLPNECAAWDKNYVMEVVLFATGFTLRYVLTTDMGTRYLHSV